MSQPDEPPSTRRSSPAVVVMMVAMVLAVVLGVLTLYAQRRAHPVQSQTTSDCDTPPAPAPPPPAPRADAGKATGAEPPPNFLTFAACGDAAKTPAKPKSR